MSIKRHIFHFYSKCLFLGLKSHLHLAQCPGCENNDHRTGKDDQRLSKSARQGRVVRDDQLSVPELVDQVSCLDGHMCSADSIEVSFGQIDRGRHDGRLGDVGVELDVPIAWLDIDVYKGWVYFDLLSALGKKDIDVDLLVLDTFELLRTLDERNSKNVTTSSGLAQEVGSIRIPTNGEGIFPAAKQRIS